MGEVKFAPNDLVHILNPQDFPLLFFEVLEFVARVEN
jgi:hypothetical protein